MSTYGDRGNIITLWQRCKARGIVCDVKEIDLEEVPDASQIDLYFFGGGQDQAQKIVSQDLQKYKIKALSKAVRLGAVFLGICGGYQLFGHYYRPAGSPDLTGLGILDLVTIASETRMIGNIVIQASSKLGLGETKLVGFENHSGKTYLGKKAASLGEVLLGYGNNGEDRTEGAFQGNVFGCYLHGPLLPKNPKFADLLLQKAFSRNGGEVELKPLDDSLEEKTHSSVIKRIQKLR